MDKRKVPIPETMLEAVRMFADEQTAHDFFVAMRWPNGVACPRDCGSVKVAYMTKARRWYCNDCKGQFTAKVGTVFEDSPIGFSKWLPAFWLLASNRNGISSHELGRALKVTQRTAWFMLQRIRLAMQDEAFDKLRGVIEADEAYIGGKISSMSNKRRKALKDSGKTAYSNKQAVLGVVERKGRVRAWTVPNLTLKSLLPKIRESIDQDATLYTDSAMHYRDINEYVLHHEAINHELHEYVRGNVHTNNIECFWAVLKRTLGGTYIHVNTRHLDRYLQEQAFRFNERENQDGPRFAKATKGADGKRLTYKALTAK
jgi:transposase-like protein